MPNEFATQWVPYIEKDYYRGYALIQHIPTEYTWSRDVRKSKSTAFWAPGYNEIYFDNATDEDFDILIDLTQMPLLPARSHAKVTVNVGIHQIELRSRHDSKITDIRGVLIEKKNNYYIYNIRAKNAYSVSSATYRVRR